MQCQQLALSLKKSLASLEMLSHCAEIDSMQAQLPKCCNISVGWQSLIPSRQRKMMLILRTLERSSERSTHNDPDDDIEFDQDTIEWLKNWERAGLWRTILKRLIGIRM